MQSGQGTNLPPVGTAGINQLYHIPWPAGVDRMAFMSTSGKSIQVCMAYLFHAQPHRTKCVLYNETPLYIMV